MKLINDRCPICKVKPVVYKRQRYWFCLKCIRSFGMPDGEQISNWAWKIPPGGESPTFRVWPFYIFDNLPPELRATTGV